MCFYYHLSKLAQRHDARALEPLNLMPGFVNGFQHPLQPVVTADRVALMRWGLIPGWMKSDAKPFDNLNARQETVAEKPMFRDAVMHRRCIVPANGFFEWQHSGGQKLPWYITMREVDDFSFAGIWEQWTNPDTREFVESFAILTTQANSLMATIHNTKERMPAMLTVQAEQEWLRADLNAGEIAQLTMPIDEKQIVAVRVNLFNPSKSAGLDVRVAIE